MCKNLYTIIFVIIICSCSTKGTTYEKQLSNNIIPLVLENDSIFIHNRNKAERIVYESYSQLKGLDSVVQRLYIKQALNDIKSDSAFKQFTMLSELYLNNPDSPIRDENLYLIFIDLCLKSDYIQEYDVEKYTEQRRLLRMNQIGTIANNLELLSDERTTLYTLCQDSIYKLLIFYDDDCGDCQNAINWFSHNNRINVLISEKKLKIIAITSSKNIKHPIPQTWTRCYSENYDEYYNIIAIPSIYLLSTNNAVVFKDIIDMQELLHYLETI